VDTQTQAERQAVENVDSSRLLVGGTAALLTACGGGGSGSAPVETATTTAVLTPEQIQQIDRASARFLQRAQFSSTENEISAVRTLGAQTWLIQQMSLPPSQSAWDWMIAQGYSTIDSNNNYNNSTQANYMAWQRIMAAPDGVRQRIALALSEFFVVGTSGVQLNWPQFAMAAYWDVLANNAFGNYRTLLEEITLNVAMGEFLNTMGNQKENAATGRVPDENYAREVMQLFSIGLLNLNINGTAIIGSNGLPEESYTQADVSNLARAFTGYLSDDSEGFFTPAGSSSRIRNVGYARRRMVLNATRHSLLEVNFLGTQIPAGADGTVALRIALDTLFNHPNVGPFFGRQMIQRLVTSDPSPAYVARVASAFNNNGQGVRGSLAAVFRAVLLDSEANDTASQDSPTFGKLREPMVRIAQWAHTFEVSSISGTWRIGNLSAPNSLGQSPLQAPSVFNFFRPGYVPPSQALALMKFTAPEFQIVNETTVPSYLNYLDGILSRGISIGSLGFDIVPAYTTELTLVGNPSALVDRLNRILCAGQLSSATVNLIVNALGTDRSTTDGSDTTKRNYIAKAILFVMASPEYLIQK
jgi:uncharacterized protein (DUF1800 family)